MKVKVLLMYVAMAFSVFSLLHCDEDPPIRSIEELWDIEVTVTGKEALISCNFKVDNATEGTKYTVGICYSKDSATLAFNNHIGIKTESMIISGASSFLKTYSYLLMDLAPGTYYCRAYYQKADEDIADINYTEKIEFIIEGETTGLSIKTKEVTNIEATTAECGGSNITQGSIPIKVKGLQYTMDEAFEEEINTILAGDDTKDFTSTLTDLDPGTTYYVRAFVSDESEVEAYGEIKTFTTATSEEKPTVSTHQVLNITTNSADVEVKFISEGSDPFTAAGVCWNTTGTPTTDDSKTDDAASVNDFTSSLSGLSANTTYYVRAYATNSVGTGYGEELSFKTKEEVKKLKIGDSHDGGVVGYLLLESDAGYDPDVQHGYIVSTSDISTGATWADAPGLCDNSTLNGFDDWYLPSSDLFQKISYASLTDLGLGPWDYWTATEDSGNPSNGVTLTGFGFLGSKDKSSNQYVRAIRNF